MLMREPARGGIFDKMGAWLCSSGYDFPNIADVPSLKILHGVIKQFRGSPKFDGADRPHNAKYTSPSGRVGGCTFALYLPRVEVHYK